MVKWSHPGGVAVAVVIEDLEQQTDDAVRLDPGVTLAPGQLPAARIVFVPFSLAEVELLPLDD